MEAAVMAWKEKNRTFRAAAGSNLRMNRVCANCERITSETEQMYTIRIEMFARAEPLVFESHDLAQDHAQKLQNLIEKMEEMDVNEAADQVYEQYSFDLCVRCRKRIHRGLKIKARQTD